MYLFSNILFVDQSFFNKKDGKRKVSSRLHGANNASGDIKRQAGAKIFLFFLLLFLVYDQLRGPTIIMRKSSKKCNSLRTFFFSLKLLQRILFPLSNEIEVTTILLFFLSAGFFTSLMLLEIHISVIIFLLLLLQIA